MTNHTMPILTSLLDTDAYKLHMQQAAYFRYDDVTALAEFVCRSNEVLGQYASEINEQIQLMSQLVLSEAEYQYLSSLPFFRAEYLQWLRLFRFNAKQVNVRNNDGHLHIQISGPWHEIILWEVPLLAIISEIVHRHRSPQVTPDLAVESLRHKLDEFHRQSQHLDLSQFKVIDFGTRRRFSHAVHQAILQTLQSDFAYLSGTSNYSFAHQLRLSPMGTQAHEWFQAHQQISPVLADSQRDALQAWLDEYPNHLGIALTDCISTDAFLRDFNAHFAHSYQGLRHDSGDPAEWAEKAITHYQQLGIDPLSKTLVFSDSLDLNKALALYRHFHHRINMHFGIGTHLTCNIPGVKPLNIVIKLLSCNGKPVAKLSDSPGKTICQDQAFISALREAFHLPAVKKAS